MSILPTNRQEQIAAPVTERGSEGDYMCGIAGIWGNATEARLRAMAQALRHRGPDDEAAWLAPDTDLGLAHRRLSIIDLSTGNQPVFNETGRIAIVFNGEIYNYKELREDLVARGHRFTTQTDTEVIVHLYEEKGTEFVTHLRGMFAIALWDGDNGQLVLARDRAGKKPLYYMQTATEFRFASEIKGLVAVADSTPTLDTQSLADYLGWGSIPQPATIYREIRSLEAAELVVVSNRRIASRKPYWHLSMTPKVRISNDEAIEQTDTLIREAVRLRLRSDVPVGSFLSGGIDSGIVTAIAAQEYPGKLITFTIGFEDDTFDERPLAKLIADRYGTDHNEILIKPDVARDLPAIAAAYDQPFGGASAVPSYYVAQAASRHVKVVLNGDGGDEVFAGYRRYVAARINGMLAWSDNAMGRPLWRLLSRVLPMPGGYRTPYAFAHRVVRGMSESWTDRFFAWSLDGLTPREKYALCGRNGATATQGRGGWLDGALSSNRRLEQIFADTSGYGLVDRMLAADYLTVLPYDLLVKMDIACMAHSLEGRSPLLDHVLTDVVARFPESVKLHGRQTKPLLRSLSRRYVPDEIVNAPKRGFEVPVARWLSGPLKPMCEDVILSRNGLLTELFDRGALERLVRRQDALDPSRWGRRTWMMLMLGIWDAYVRPRCQTVGSAG